MTVDTLAVYRMAKISIGHNFKENEQSVGKLFGQVLVDAGLRDQPLCRWTPPIRHRIQKFYMCMIFHFFLGLEKSKIFQ